MKARKLIDDAPFPAETVALLSKAFDQAWHKIEARFESDDTREHAGNRLAGIILMLARVTIGDLEQLRDAALRVFSRDLD